MYNMQVTVFACVQNVEDNHEEAARVAPQALRLCQLVSVYSPFAFRPSKIFPEFVLKACTVTMQLEESEDWEDGIDDVIQQFEKETGRRPIYTVCFY